MKKGEGRIVSVNISKEKGTKKTPIEMVTLLAGYGIEGDAHVGNWHRQVSLLAVESVRKMGEEKETEFSPGDFGENMTTEGIALVELPIGSLLKMGDAVVLETTQIGKECHDRCHIYYQSGDCIMPKEGIFARVVEGGCVKKGYRIEVIGNR